MLFKLFFISFLILASSFVFAQTDNIHNTATRQDTSKSDRMMRQDKTKTMQRNQLDTMRSNNRTMENNRRSDSTYVNPDDRMMNKNRNTPATVPPDSLKNKWEGRFISGVAILILDSRYLILDTEYDSRNPGRMAFHPRNSRSLYCMDGYTRRIIFRIPGVLQTEQRE